MVLAISPRGLSKAAIAMGGFLIFIGVIMVGVFVLVLTKHVDMGTLEGILENLNNRLLFSGMLLAVGILDVISGIILWRR